MGLKLPIAFYWLLIKKNLDGFNNNWTEICRLTCLRIINRVSWLRVKYKKGVSNSENFGLAASERLIFRSFYKENGRVICRIKNKKSFLLCTAHSFLTCTFSQFYISRNLYFEAESYQIVLWLTHANRNNIYALHMWFNCEQI